VLTRLTLTIRRLWAPSGSLSAPKPNPTAITVDEAVTALTRSGLSYGRPEDAAFLRSALRGEEWPSGLTLRKHGSPLNKHELRALGYRANLILSRECLAILTEKGREDPKEAAQFIVSAFTTSRSTARAIGDVIAAGGPHGMVQVVPNNMAAGPCSGCLAPASTPIPATQAPTGPLPECPHPEQCRLHFRYIYDPD
jgi:hypothetical protein